MDVHTATVVTYDRLRHERHGLSVSVCDVVDGVLEVLNFVSLFDQRIRIHTDLALTSSRDFVVVHFHFHAQLFERQAHGRTKVLKRIDRWNWEVTALHARTMSFVTVLVVFS